MSKYSLPSWTLPSACILLTLGLLAVGLWPFNPSPSNKVTWLPNGAGLELGDRALMYSQGALLPALSQATADSSCRLQVSLQPDSASFKNTGTILAFYTPENSLGFRLLQYGDELLVRKDYRDEHRRLATAEIELEHAVEKDRPVTFTISSDANGAVAYRDGLRAGSSPRLKFSCADLSGQLIIGDSPVTQNSWAGRLLDLRLYDQEPIQPQASGNVLERPTNNSPDVLAHGLDRSTLAHYAFTEGSGTIAHNSEGPAPDLLIPARFRTLHRQFLIMPWNETPDKLEFRDIAINIFGFVPFGLLLFVWLRLHHRSRQALALAVLAGFLVSLTIEVLQAFIPSRGSGILDIFTNTFGIYLGALLLRWSIIQSFAAKLWPTEQSRA